MMTRNRRRKQSEKKRRPQEDPGGPRGGPPGRPPEERTGGTSPYGEVGGHIYLSPARAEPPSHNGHDDVPTRPGKPWEPLGLWRTCMYVCMYVCMLEPHTST